MPGKIGDRCSRLNKLKELAKCDDDHQLETTITTAERKIEKQDEYDRISVGLIERTSLPDVRQIEEEASGYELDSLKSEILSGEDRLKALQDEVFKTGSEHGRLLQEYERLQTSEESTLQAQKAEDAVARVRPAISQYLRLRLASEVLHRAIESYLSPFPEHVAAREEMPGGHQEFLDGPQTSDHVRGVFAPVRGGGAPTCGKRASGRWIRYSCLYCSKLLQRICAIRRSGQYVSGCEIMELPRMGG